MKNLNSCRVNIMVSNMDVALEFYSGTLGLTLLNRYGDHYAEIDAAGLVLGLHPASDKLIVGNNLSIGLGVLNFEETVKGLESKGIQFKMVNEGWNRLAHFSDPDGNQLYLVEKKE